jgi:hypothetical protein
MKLLRRRFLQLVAGAGALPVVSQIAGAQTFRHGQYDWSLAMLLAEGPTSPRA